MYYSVQGPTGHTLSVRLKGSDERSDSPRNSWTNYGSVSTGCLAASTLATTPSFLDVTDTITGEPSTDWEHQHVSHNWSFWNGRIQMLIREELRDNPDMIASNSIHSASIPVDRPLLEILRAEFLAYAAPVTALSRIMAELAGMQNVSTGASASEQQSETSKGLPSVHTRESCRGI